MWEAMNQEYMREFVSLADTLNFTKTARTFFITQPTLSKHIGVLERELGVPLLERSTHEVELTEAGLLARDAFRDMLARFELLRSDLDLLERSKERKLSIGVLYYGFTGLMSTMLAPAIAANPAIDFTFVSGQPHQIIEEVVDGRCDLACVMSTCTSSAPSLSFDFVESLPLVAFVDVNHPLAPRGSICLNDLRDETIVSLRQDPQYMEAVLASFARAGMDAVSLRVIEQVDLVPYEIRGTRFVFVGPTPLREMPHAGLTILDFDDEAATMDMGFCWRSDNDNPCIRDFISFVDRQRAAIAKAKE